jgi:hypothetical protein
MKTWIAMFAAAFATACLPGVQGAADPPGFDPPPHGFLAKAPKVFARVQAVDVARRQLTLVLDRDGQVIARPVRLDVDVYLHGGLGSLADVRQAARVWVVFDPGPAMGDLTTPRFIADELGLQTIHDEWSTIDEVDVTGKTLRLLNDKGEQTVLPLAAALTVRKGERHGGAGLMGKGDRVRYQTHYEDGRYRVSEVLDAAALELDAAEQRDHVRKTLTREGIPGEIVPDAQQPREASLLLYRPGGDWARALSPGDEVSVALGAARVKGSVRRILPWGEKTSLGVTLAANAPAAQPHQTVRVFLPRPPSVQSALPPGLGRATDKNERIDWLLSSFYCSCGQGPDTCTGHLYTLSMCNEKGCPMPRFMKDKIGAWIDQGKTDAEILAIIEQEQGPLCRRIHLRK